MPLRKSQKGERAAKSAEMWISPDPARQFASPYAYSMNPVNGADADGMWFGDKTVSGRGSCVDGPSQIIYTWQGEANSPQRFAFDRGFALLYNNDGAVNQARELAAWANKYKMEGAFQFTANSSSGSYTNNEPTGVDPRVAPGSSMPRAWLHIHPPGSVEGLSGSAATGDGYWAAYYPVYAVTSTSGRVWYTDNKLIRYGRQVELPRLNIPSSANPGYFPKFVSPR
jgi:hypothetical protein